MDTDHLSSSGVLFGEAFVCGVYPLLASFPVTVLSLAAVPSTPIYFPARSQLTPGRGLAPRDQGPSPGSDAGDRMLREVLTAQAVDAQRGAGFHCNTLLLAELTSARFLIPLTFKVAKSGHL